MPIETDGFGTIMKQGETPTSPDGGGFGGGGGGGFFIYREGEPNPNMTTVFPTFLGAYNAAYATGVPCTIVVDDTLGSCHIADNGNYDLHQITLSGLGISQFQSPRTILFVGDGVTWNQGFCRVTNGLWIPVGLTSQAFLGTFTGPPYTRSMLIDNGAGVFVSNNGALFDVSQTEMGLGLLLESGGIMVTNGSSGPAFFTGSTGSVDLYIQVGEAAYLDSGIMAGSSGTLHVTVLSDSAQLPSSFSFTGGININTPLPQAQNLVPYAGSTNPTPQQAFPLLQVGQMFFNETLGQPLWWNGSQWVSASGTIEVLNAPGSLTLNPAISTSVLINATEAQANFTLPDGVDGQMKLVVSASPAPQSGTNFILLILTHINNNNAIDLNAAGFAVLLVWSTSLGGWQAIAFYNGASWD